MLVNKDLKNKDTSSQRNNRNVNLATHRNLQSRFTLRRRLHTSQLYNNCYVYHIHPVTQNSSISEIHQVRCVYTEDGSRVGFRNVVLYSVLTILDDGHSPKRRRLYQGTIFSFIMVAFISHPPQLPSWTTVALLPPE
jgi:hypothetical protein